MPQQANKGGKIIYTLFPVCSDCDLPPCEYRGESWIAVYRGGCCPGMNVLFTHSIRRYILKEQVYSAKSKCQFCKAVVNMLKNK